MDISTLNAVYNPYISSLTAPSYQSFLSVQQISNDGLNNGVAQASASYQAQISDYGQILGALSSLQSAAQNLANPLTLSAATANSSAPNILAASAAAGTLHGTYNVQVNQLALPETLVSASQSNATSTIGSGTPSTLSFQFGNGASQNITIDGSNNTLSGIASSINSANLGVSATVVSDGTNYQLALNGQSGTSNTFNIAASGDAAIASMLTYQQGGTSNGLTQTVAAQDAQGTVNGIQFTNASNVVANTTNGLTLNLSATGTATVTVAPDSVQAAKAVQSFVDTYNSAQATIGEFQSSDLAGDATLSTIRDQTASTLNTIQSGLSGPYNALAQIGITSNQDGTLAFDKQAFQNAFTANPGNVAQIFSNNGNGVADQAVSQLDGIVGSSGTIQTEISGLQSAAQFNQEIQAETSFATSELQQSAVGQYSALQMSLSAMQSTSQFLSSQFAQTGLSLLGTGNMPPAQMLDNSVISNMASQSPGMQFSGLAAQYDLTQQSA